MASCCNTLCCPEKSYRESVVTKDQSLRRLWTHTDFLWTNQLWHLNSTPGLRWISETSSHEKEATGQEQLWAGWQSGWRHGCQPHPTLDAEVQASELLSLKDSIECVREATLAQCSTEDTRTAMVKAQATGEAVLGSTPQLPAVGADTLPGKLTEPVGAEASESSPQFRG